MTREQARQRLAEGNRTMTEIGATPPDLTREQTATLAAFADTLIPGDSEFPRASATDVVALMAERLEETRGPGTSDALCRLLDILAGGSLEALNHADRANAVAALESSDPIRFIWARTALYYSYYQQPKVVAAIRSMGFVYNDAPLPEGYAMLPFDPAPGGTAPLTNVGGSYKRTAEIARVELGPLAAQRASELGR